MRYFKTLTLFGLVVLSACGSTASNDFFGPAGFSFAGLTYTGGGNSACCGGAFSGMDLSTNTPTTGNATYQGTMRGNILGDYRNGTVDVVADFDTSTVNVFGSIDFTGVSTGDGIVSFNQTAQVNGNHFQAASTNDTLFGHFYGDNAVTVAGSISTQSATGQQVSANFIANNP